MQDFVPQFQRYAGQFAPRNWVYVIVLINFCVAIFYVLFMPEFGTLPFFFLFFSDTAVVVIDIIRVGIIRIRIERKVQ